jgi:hypothetical protein
MQTDYNQKTDLFSTPELLPIEVQNVINKYSEDWGESYEECENMLKELRPLGYTFDYYLDASPFNLQPIEPITTLEQFAELINSEDGWQLEFNDIIETNKWKDETGISWGICNDGTNRLQFDEFEMMAVINPIENKN